MGMCIMVTADGERGEERCFLFGNWIARKMSHWLGDKSEEQKRYGDYLCEFHCTI